MCIASAIFDMFKRLIFRSPRSTSPTYVLWRPARSAKPSWDIPWAFRALRTAFPKAIWILSVDFTGLGYGNDDDRSTVYTWTDFKWLCLELPLTLNLRCSRRFSWGLLHPLQKEPRSPFADNVTIFPWSSGLPDLLCAALIKQPQPRGSRDPPSSGETSKRSTSLNRREYRKRPHRVGPTVSYCHNFALHSSL